LFIGSKKEVVIVDPAGGTTKEISRIDVTKAPGTMDSSDAENKGLTFPGAVTDLLISGNTLAVIIHEYRTESLVDALAGATGSGLGFEETNTRVLLYDLTDRANPTYLTAFGQSGTYSSSRLQGNVLYLVSDYYLEDPSSASKTDPATFVPTVEVAGEDAVPMPVDKIHILPQPQGPRYSVVTAVDVAGRAKLGEQAVLGGAETVYMSAQNLYLAAWENQEQYALPSAYADALGFDHLSWGSSTRIVRIALGGGTLAVEADASIPGNLVSQFALDEYDGHLRAAVTISGETRTVTEQDKEAATAPGDDPGVWEGEPPPWVQTTALIVLDSALQPTGVIGNLAKDEMIQSVRFTGPVGYVVTFRQTDPLFAIDLADPAKPTVMSALKIPGFSTYLHPWGEGLLLGLGRDGTWESATDTMKLSMFNTSDPFNVTESDVLPIPYNEAAALTNHHAIWADVDRGLIGFGVFDWDYQYKGDQANYIIYSYRDGEGFKEAATLGLGRDLGWSTYEAISQIRGVQIGDFLYLASPATVAVYSLGSFDQVASLTVIVFTDEESGDVMAPRGTMVPAPGGGDLILE
jgi:uncharacterized secreted protein with C-terminal beta-propeller domain